MLWFSRPLLPGSNSDPGDAHHFVSLSSSLSSRTQWRFFLSLMSRAISQPLWPGPGHGHSFSGFFMCSLGPQDLTLEVVGDIEELLRAGHGPCLAKGLQCSGPCPLAGAALNC